jgi:hypothetical protein
MPSVNKLVAKFLFQQNKIDIDDIRRLLDAFGYIERRNPSSECIFHKKGSYPINVPTIKGRTVKSQYVKRMVKFLKLEEWYDEHEGDKDS